MILLKNADVSAELPALNPIMLVAWMVVDQVLGRARVTDIYRKNRTGSYHRVGLATDFGTKELWADYRAWRRERLNDAWPTVTGTPGDQVRTIKSRLPGFDVVLEDFGGDNEHLHVEFDPRV